MSRFITLLLGANTLFEYAVAIAALVGGLVAVPLNPNQLILGGNAIALGTLSLLTLRTAEPGQRRMGLMVFAVFHVATTLAWSIVTLTTGTFTPPLVPHLLFAIGFIVALMRR